MIQLDIAYNICRVEIKKNSISINLIGKLDRGYILYMKHVFFHNLCTKGLKHNLSVGP